MHPYTRTPIAFMHALPVIRTGALLLLLLGTCIQVHTAEKKNASVSYAVAITGKNIRGGSPAALEVRLTPVQGIHINMTPPIEIRLDSNDVIATSGTMKLPPSTKDGYLDVSRPIILPITLAAGLRPGKKKIGGTIVYFYCSEKEGWCSRFKQKFEVGLTIAK